MKLDLDKVPYQIRVIIEQYLKPSNPRTENDVLLLSVLSQLSRMACFCRVKIKNEMLQVDTFPNIYCINFARSGFGKDKTIRNIQQACGFFEEYEDKVFETYKEDAEDRIELKAEKLKDSKAERAKYIKENSPRNISTSKLSNGTMEGLTAIREAIQDAGVGSLHWQCSEFLEFCSKEKNEEFLTLIYEIFDNGDSDPKIIKGEKTAKRIKGIPQTIFVHSAIGDEKRIRKLRHYFDIGYARRSLTAFPEDTYYPVMTIQKRVILAKTASEGKIIAKDLFKAFFEKSKPYESLKNSFRTYEHREISINKEAENFFFEYDEKNFQQAQALSSVNNKGIVAEVSGKMWKSIKIAGMIAILENEKDFIITKEIAEKATYIADFFSASFKRFYGMEEILEVEQLFNFILENQEDQVIGRTLIRKQSFAPKDKFSTTKWINDTVSELKDYCKNRGCELVYAKNGNRGVSYRIEKQPEHETISAFEDIYVNYAIANNKELNCIDYKNKAINFENFHNVAMNETRYMPCHLLKDKRNLQGVSRQNMLVMDIDNDDLEITVKEAKEIFKDFKCLFVTTKSHKKDKGEKGIKERFRIIFPTYEIKDVETKRYKKIMENICEEFRMIGAIDLQAFKDRALPFACNNGEYEYSKGLKMLNWKAFDYGHEKKKEFKQSYSKEIPMNVVKNLEIKDAKKNIRSWNDFEYLSLLETAPVFCPFHDDKNPSAMVGRSENGSLFIKCVSCDTIKFNK